MPRTPEEARAEAIRRARQQIQDATGGTAQVTNASIVGVARRNETRRLYNKLTVPREPCDKVWEHWVVRYDAQFTIQMTIVAGGEQVTIERASSWYSVEEWQFEIYFDCPGIEDLEPIPDHYASVVLDGVEVWRGTSLTLRGGALLDGAGPRELIAMSDGDRSEEQAVLPASAGTARG
jgi:hypothetical protein